MENKTILFLDMDGCVADFEKGTNGDIKNMFKPGFFRNLPVLEEGLNETIEEIQKQGITVKILSKACVKKGDKRFIGQMIDKVEWVKEHIPCIDELNIIIQGSDEDKGSIVELYKHHECVLVDDYTPNLANWTFAGGKGIKRAKRIKPNRPFKQILNLAELANEGL